ncbi:pyridoxamine 5'-phosphate oxidase family protein [Desertivirga arenae]|uniref:pyridoxamine 5'-phosphate oxidase family protein n=1 Tax=Desertivirga arenae TaxID=2810309 RepID=UPI001A96FB22|nr:pyridoxamine 5'-phosphate oxidase family protein [Pedobacter sp. SYSU D00823]
METTYYENIKKFRELIDGIDIAILSTYNGNEIKARPMATTEVDEDGNIWFFTNEYSGKVDDVEAEHKVSVTYSNSTHNTYVVVSGNAIVVEDRIKMEKLFNSATRAFFPQGVDTPDLALLKVRPYEIEYWINQHDEGMLRFMGILGSSPVIDEELHHGEHGKIKL